MSDKGSGTLSVSGGGGSASPPPKAPPHTGRGALTAEGELKWMTSLQDYKQVLLCVNDAQSKWSTVNGKEEGQS